MTELCRTTEAELLQDNYLDDLNDYLDTQPQKFKGLSVYNKADLKMLIWYADANILDDACVKLMNAVHDLKYARIETHKKSARRLLQSALNFLPVDVVQQHLDDVEYDTDTEFLYKTYGISSSAEIGSYEDRP